MEILQKNKFIEIFRLEDIKKGIFNNYQRYDFYQIVWFTGVSGDDIYMIDFNDYRIKKDQLVVVFPGQIDKLDIEGKAGFLFAVDNEVFFRLNQRLNSPYLNGYYGNIFITIPDTLKDKLNAIMDLIFSEYHHQKRLGLMECYLEALLFHVSSLLLRSEKENAGVNDTTVAEFMKLIDKNFVSERETIFYARQLGISPKKMNEISIRGTGKTVKQHIYDRLILEIKKEIRLGCKSLKEIAFDLGFSEPAYFTRFFKQKAGKTPTEFRDNLPSG